MADQVVLVEKTEGVAILTLNRPEQLNAMNAQLSAELREAVARMTDDDEVGCLVITGAGKRAFSAGGDIHEQREDDRRYSQAELDARTAVRARGSYEIGACPKPTIGMMNGLAYGGAAVLASSLDMRVGCEHSSFRFLAAAYGRINSTWTLPNQVKNKREAVMGVKALLLRDLGCDLEEQWANERDYTTNVVRGAKAEAAFPEFIARHGRPIGSS